MNSNNFTFAEKKSVIALSTYNFPLSPVIIDTIAQKFKACPDSMIEFLEFNKILSLAINNLNSWKIIDTLGEETKKILFDNKNHFIEHYDNQKKEVKRLAENFTKAGYKALFLKGTALNLVLYHKHPGVRHSNDLDIIAAPDSMAVYEYMVNNLGYKSISSEEEKKAYAVLFQHFAPLVNNDEMYIDVHYRYTQEGDGYELNYERIFRDSMRVAFLDGGPHIPVPCLEDILINLCYHQFQHEYRETRYTIKAHADIFNLVYNKEINWDRLIKNVIADGIQFPIAYSLYFTNQVFSEFLDVNIIPKFVLDVLMPEGFERRKDAIVTRHFFNNEPLGYWKYPYIDRMFFDVWDLRDKVCRAMFLATAEEEWKKIAMKYGFEYDELYQFTTKIWIEKDNF